jgi:hypothetical protein
MPSFLQRFLGHKATPGIILTLVVVILEALVGAADDR